MTKIFFHDHVVRSKLKDRRAFKMFLTDLFQKEKKTLKQADFIFCSDEYLLDLNKQYLNHNYFTDTMTFVLSEPGHPIIAEAYISVDRIIANSKELNESYANELARVIIHSSLHMIGYDDHPPFSAKKMQDVQEKYLRQWNVSRETKL